jgi:hypothetical protein
MYVYQPTDTTSPESIPSVIVGSDGSRYYLDRDFLKASWIHINSNNPGFNAQGVFVTWNDGSDGSTYFANNRGSGAGGYVFRNLSADGLTELSRIVFSANGSITTPSGITAAADINSSGNLHAQGGTVFLNAAGDRDLSYSAGPNTYNLPNAPLIVNGSQAVTQATLLSNQQANGVGSVAVGSSSGVNPPTLPGTWAQTGSNFNNVWQYVRVA